MHEFRPPAVVEADAELLRAIRRGDADAVAGLVQRQGRFVHALATAVAGADRVQPGRADVLTRHVFVQAWRNAEAAEPGRAFRPWLAQLTLRVAAHEGLQAAPVSIDQLSDDAVADLVGPEAEWPPLPTGLADDVVAAVLAESFVAPLARDDIAASDTERPWLRAALVGALGTLLFLLVGTIVLSVLGGNDAGDQRTVELQPTGLVEGADGEVTVIDTIDDLRFEYDAALLERRSDGSFYEAWVTTGAGELIPLGSFNGGDDVVLTGAVQSLDASALTIGLATASAVSDGSRVVPVNIVASADLQE
ncbi:MAG: hypothetical protein AAGF73_14815 [Actinomycetota bacterium]